MEQETDVVGAPAILAELAAYRRELVAMLDEVDRFTELVNKAPAGLWMSLHLGVHSSRSAPPRTTRPPSIPTAGAPRRRSSTIKPAIIEILKAHAPEAIHAGQVVAELRARGIPLSAKDPKATAVTAMIRMDRDRRAGDAYEGVEKLPGNMFRWVEWFKGVEPGPIARELPSEQSRAAAQE